MFRHPGKKDLYIALADRWRPDIVQREDYADGRFSDTIQRKFRQMFDPKTEFVFTEEDAREMRINAAVSDYVWLPLEFDQDRVLIRWLDEWKTEDYE